MSLAVISTRTLWMIGDGGGTELFTPVPEVVRVNFPDTAVDLVDTTSHDVTSGYKTYMPGLKDGSNVTAEIVAWLPWMGPHYQLRVDRAAGTKRNFKMRYRYDNGTDDNTCIYSAYIVGINTPANIGETLKGTIQTKVTGAPVWDYEAIAASLPSVFPTSGAQGASNMKVYIFGKDTAFADLVSVVSFSGTGITVNSTVVHSPNVIEVSISIAGGATLGARNVTVTTGAEVVTRASGFTVA